MKGDVKTFREVKVMLNTFLTSALEEANKNSSCDLKEMHLVKQISI
jgi:hypothetical protein